MGKSFYIHACTHTQVNWTLKCVGLYLERAHKIIKRKRNSLAAYFNSRLLEIVHKFGSHEVSKFKVKTTPWNPLAIMPARHDTIWLIWTSSISFRAQIYKFLLFSSVNMLLVLQTCGKYIHRTLKNSSMIISNLIGPAEQMSLANHPIKGFYFLVGDGPLVCHRLLWILRKNLTSIEHNFPPI